MPCLGARAAMTPDISYHFLTILNASSTSLAKCLLETSYPVPVDPQSSTGESFTAHLSIPESSTRRPEGRMSHLQIWKSSMDHHILMDRILEHPQQHSLPSRHYFLERCSLHDHT